MLKKLFRLFNNHDAIKIKRAAGCVVYRQDQAGALWLLLIRDKYGKWTIPKGHLEKGEDDPAAAVREVFEETGLHGELGPLISRIEYQVLSKKGARRLKQVAFFLMRTAEIDATPQAKEGISAAEWCAPDLALARIGYPQVRGVLEQALVLLR